MLQIVAEPLVPGAIVAGGFRLERVVGEGGMGVVWAARHMPSGRVVALKFLIEGRETDPRNQARFLREARAAMAVVHPNVARVEAVLETDAGVPFMVMELLVGESLRQLLRRQRLLTPVQTAQIIAPVVDAVAQAHAMRIIHRDLKPENVFLLPGPHGPQVRVLDFGIAKELARDGQSKDQASLTSTGAMIGTPLYMAPEQIFADEDLDGRVDCWALGIMIYECLAGETPTEAQGFGPIIKRITSDPIMPLERMRPGLPGKITRLVARMLTRDRMQRPALAEVRAVLAEVIAAGDDAGPSAPMVPPMRAMQPMQPIAGFTPMMSPASTTLGAAHTAPQRPTKTPLVLGLVGGLLLLAGVITAGVLFVPSFLAKTDPKLPGNENAVLQQASDAAQKRDGKTCLTALDRYDGLPNVRFKSTDPAGGAAVTRSMCLMLTGDCEGGKTLYRKWSTVAKAPEIEASVEGMASKYCEGDKVSQRDELLRATDHVSQASIGQPKPTIAECKQWTATVKKLAPLVKPKDANDHRITSIASSFGMESTMCFAQAGDCNGALATFRDDYNARYGAQYPNPTDREKSMRLMYDGVVGQTTCKGKP